VKALLATARPPIAVVFINPRRVTSAAINASGALIFIETHFGCSQRKEGGANRYVVLYITNFIVISFLC
jgi:hypothetical protein